MALISKVELWKDCGFTDGCVEVPAYSDISKLPAVDLTLVDGFYPSKARMFSEMKIKCDNGDVSLHPPKRSFYILQQCSYLRITVDYNNSQDFTQSGQKLITQITYYGWIDSVTLESDTTDFGMVVIKWHVDLWRTYLASATFGAGTVTRRSSSSGTYPLQQCPSMVSHQGGSAEVLSLKDSLMWAVVGYVRETDSQSTTESTYLIWPFAVTGSDVSNFYTLKRTNSEGSGLCPRVADFVGGVFDEMLGLTPTRITGAWITPFAPGTYAISGRDVTLNQLDGALITHTKDSLTYACFALNGGSIYSPQETQTTFELTSTETSTWALLNCRGEVVYSLPPRITVTGAQIRNCLSPSGSYLAVRFLTDLHSNTEMIPALGLEARIPLPSVDVSGNSWSEYVYSGQRQYEIDSRNLQQDIAHTEGYTSAFTGGMSGAMSGAMTGLMFGASAGPVGAVVGAVAGVAGSLISNEVNYNVEKGANDQLQSIEDTYQARQTENLLMYGNPADWVQYGLTSVKMVELVVDEYSSKNYNQQLTLNGVKVSEPRSSCTSLVQGTGPLQISQLVVGGSIPVEAKRYIKMRLENGVRLIASASEAEEEETV